MTKVRHTVIPRTLIFVFKEDKVLLLKYSGKGENITQEKIERKDIYNGLGGHVEKDEDIIASAVRETQEEAGIRLLHPKLKGLLNVTNFAGNDCIVFIVTGTTHDAPVTNTIEGTPEWVAIDQLHTVRLFEDVQPIIEKLLTLKQGEMISGTSTFDGKFGLVENKLTIV